MKEHIPLKYECMDKFEQVLSTCEDQNVRQLMIDLRDLILFQMREMMQQRAEIVAIKHKQSWKQYDKN